jgi:hypothetical protein
MVLLVKEASRKYSVKVLRKEPEVAHALMRAASALMPTHGGRRPVTIINQI